MKGKPWSDHELHTLQCGAVASLSWREISRRIGRTPEACQQMASKRGWAKLTKGPKVGAPMQHADIERRVRKASDRFVRDFGRLYA